MLGWGAWYGRGCSPRFRRWLVITEGAGRGWGVALTPPSHPLRVATAVMVSAALASSSVSLLFSALGQALCASRGGGSGLLAPRPCSAAVLWVCGAPPHGNCPGQPGPPSLPQGTYLPREVTAQNSAACAALGGEAG